MEITKETQHKAIAALRQCAKENENKPADTGAVRVTDLCRDVADYLEKLAADEHPKQSWWRPVTEWPRDKQPILMKLSNGKYQYTEWEDDGKGFNSGFAEINFGGGAMMRLPVEYEVVAWRPLADVINEYVNHGVIATEPDPKADIKAKRLADCELSVRTINICAANDIDTLGDLCKLHKTDWLRFRNGGKKSLFELDDLLHDNGLDWAKPEQGARE